MFLDNSACNLASLNLMKFRDEHGDFNDEAFCRAAHTLIVAQDIIVDNASYPTEQIGTNSFDYRPLGLGYANLGALLMARGLAYDSDEGRDYAATLTALMTGQAYLTSSQLAERLGTFKFFEDNREPMTEVMSKHRAAINTINEHRVPAELLQSARDIWNDAYSHGIDYGYRNAQVSVLAPTGTIGFMMDCDTTGIEPDLALVKYKKLSGGGVLKIVNRSVEEALHRLGYSDDQILEILDYVNREETIEGAPHLVEEHLGVFDCAFRPLNGSRSIHYMGHIRMMGAVQPFLSGAISKTVNLPEEATVEDISKTYLEAWKLGVKAVAIYRTTSKRTQPMSAGEKKETFGGPNSPLQPQRRRLPEERQSITHKFSIAGHEGYITVGLYDDGTPGEIFVRMSKEGSVVSGLMDCFATATSIMLQYGVPLKVLVDKFAHTRFEPSGWTGSKKIPMAKSIMDYLFRWLALKFLPETDTEVSTAEEKSSTPTLKQEETERQIFELHADAPPCVQCGSIMVRNGACYKCLNCGVSWGCS
jgi:ribonucleoside-diphosphate reductase alpha chain